MDDATRTLTERLHALERSIAYKERAQRRQKTRRRGLLARVLAVTVIAALLVTPLGTLAANFVDLNPGSGHNGNINAIADAGISRGCVADGSRYCPNDLVTREQMASFLARTAGLGGNPPVVNALTAQSVPDGSITVAKLSANGSTAGQVLTSTGAGVAWQNSAPPGVTYARTVVVSPVGTATQNGAALVAALAGITTASAANPFLLKVEPGIYDIGNTASLSLKQFVDIEGSGEGVTKITHQEAVNIFTVNNLELRSLTLECTGGSASAGCTALRINSGQSPRLTHVTIKSSTTTNSATGIFVDQSSPTLQHVTIIVSGATGNNFGVNYQGGAGSNVLTIRNSTISVEGGSQRFGVSATSAGTKVVVVEHSRISATSGQPPISISGASITARVAASQLDGGASSVTSGATLTCAGVYDENFVFSSSTCP